VTQPSPNLNIRLLYDKLCSTDKCNTTFQ
jgi:hypothetical protein